MRKQAVFLWCEIALPAAWLFWGAGFLLAALTGDDALTASWFQAAAIMGLVLATAAWMASRSLARLSNTGWQSGMLVILVLAAVMGMMLGAAQPAMLIVALAGLAWWDLSDFSHRLKQFSRADSPEVDAMVAAHLRRLALALGLGLTAGLAALSVSIRLTLGGAMVLGTLAVLLIRVGIRRTIG